MKLCFRTDLSTKEQISMLLLLAEVSLFSSSLPLSYIWWKFKSDKDELYLKPLGLYFRKFV